MKLLKKNVPLMKDALKNKTEIRLFPTIREREKWNSLPESVQTYFVEKADEFLGVRWPILSATKFMEYSKSGNRSDYETLFFKRRYALGHLVLAECIQNQGRYWSEIIDLAWAICEESSWTVPAHQMERSRGVLPFPERNEIALFSADTSALLSITCYLLRFKLEREAPNLIERIEFEVYRRIITPYLTRNFDWMGFKETQENTWNPWINSNVLVSMLFLSDIDPMERIRGVEKIMNSLDNFLDYFDSYGSKENSPIYWYFGGSMFLDALEQLYLATNGMVSIFQEPLVKKLANRVKKTHIHGQYFASSSKTSAKLNENASVVLKFGDRIKDPSLLGTALELVDYTNEIENDAWFNIYRNLAQLFPGRSYLNNYGVDAEVWKKKPEAVPATESASYNSYGSVMGAWFEGVLLMVSGGVEQDLYAKEIESRSYMTFHDGSPLYADPPEERYFTHNHGSEIYDLWNVQSAYHNLPIVNGYMQHAGPKFATRDMVRSVERTQDQSAEIVSISMYLEDAYPSEAGIESWIRNVIIKQPKSIKVEPTFSILDEFSFNQSPSKISWNFLAHPRTLRKYLFESGMKGTDIYENYENARPLSLRFGGKLESCAVDEIPLVDLGDESIDAEEEEWAENLYRISLKVNNPTKDGWIAFKIGSG